MRVEITRSRSANGRGGVAWSCDLVLDGVVAAHVTDAGDGGATHVAWIDMRRGESVLRERFREYANANPKRVRALGRSMTFDGNGVEWDGMYIAALVDEYERARPGVRR